MKSASGTILDRPSVIDLDAKLTSELVPEAFRGMDRFEGRKAVVKALEEEGTLLDSKDYTVPLGLSERTGEPVEPIVSLQWFYNTDEAAEHALQWLDEGNIQIHPQRYTKVNRDWLGRLRPWNISRQLWWGHQIPAWYDAEGNVYVPDPDKPELDCDQDPRYADLELTRDPDVFDTWFSSNLWPFSTLGWPDTDDPFYKKFYPTSVLVTGYDILPIWVARMELAGYEFTDQAPFKDVLLHGLVLDAEGQKMSKSKGNGIDPLVVMDEFGADALRFATTHASTGGQDIRWDARRVEMGRNFNNKLWNAARFAFMNLEGNIDHGMPESLADRWIVSRLQRAVQLVTGHLEAFDIGAANRAAYDFVWSEFCDWYLEAAKPQLREGNERTRFVLKTVLTHILKLLHPLVPFITSELYEALGFERQVGLESWPDTDDSLISPEAETAFKHLQDAVGAVRNLRAEAGLSPTQNINVYARGEAAHVLTNNREVFESLARVTLLADAPSGAALSQIVPDIELKLPFEGLIDVDEWRAKQEKKLQEVKKDLATSERKLGNEKFVTNAPDEVVAEERRRLEEARALLEGLNASLAQV